MCIRDRLKAENQIEWVRQMNACVAQAEETIKGELIYLSLIHICIEIPKISVNLPIYHGTSEKVLSSGVGHVQGSSLPIGGNNTRSIFKGSSSV